MPHFRRMLARMREIQPHVIVVPAPGPYGILGFLYARMLKVPLCVAFQTDLEKLAELYWHPMLAAPSMGLLRWLNACVFGAGDAVVTISNAMMEKAWRAGVHDVRLVGTPLGKAFVSDPVQPLSNDLDRVLFVGRLAPEKNLEAYVEAAAALPNVTFRIAGDGPLRSFVEERAAALPNLEYLGWQSRDGVVNALDDVDMLVLPSKVEAFGTVVLEAMARRRLVLTSAACGINDWPSLADGIYTFKPEENLGAVIRDIGALSPDERDKKAAYAMMQSRAVNEETVDEWLAVLSGLTKRRIAAQLAPEPLLHHGHAAPVRPRVQQFS
jgi:glycosyltransferase involved in cell wall biosynthesis